MLADPQGTFSIWQDGAVALLNAFVRSFPHGILAGGSEEEAIGYAPLLDLIDNPGRFFDSFVRILDNRAFETYDFFSIERASFILGRAKLGKAKLEDAPMPSELVRKFSALEVAELLFENHSFFADPHGPISLPHALRQALRAHARRGRFRPRQNPAVAAPHAA